MHLSIGRLPLLLLLVSFLSLLYDRVDAQATSVGVPSPPYMDPFNLPPEATAPYVEASNAVDTKTVLAPNITGLKGVQPHGDRLKRTLCYCSSPVAGTRNSGSSYYHMEYYNSQLDRIHSLNWTCIHRKEDNACKDKPKVHDRQCRTVDGNEFCFEQKAKVVSDDKYSFGGSEHPLPFNDQKNGPFPAPWGSKTSEPRDVITRVCASLCKDFVGHPADPHDEFFNGIAYFKNSIDEFNFLDDICLDNDRKAVKCPDPK